MKVYWFDSTTHSLTYLHPCNPATECVTSESPDQSGQCAWIDAIGLSTDWRDPDSVYAALGACVGADIEFTGMYNWQGKPIYAWKARAATTQVSGDGSFDRVVRLYACHAQPYYWCSEESFNGSGPQFLCNAYLVANCDSRLLAGTKAMYGSQSFPMVEVCARTSLVFNADAGTVTETPIVRVCAPVP